MTVQNAARGVAIAVAPAAKFPAETPPPRKRQQRGGQRPPPAGPLDPPCIGDQYRPFGIKAYQVSRHRFVLRIGECTRHGVSRACREASAVEL